MFVGNYSQAVGLRGGEKGNNLPGCFVMILEEKFGVEVKIKPLLKDLAKADTGWVICAVDAMSKEPTISIHHVNSKGKLCGWEILKVKFLEVVAHGVDWLLGEIEYARRLGMEAD